MDQETLIWLTVLRHIALWLAFIYSPIVGEAPEMENDIVSIVNQRIGKVWQSWARRLRAIDNDLKIPLIYPDLRKRVLLFVGLNPSFSPKGLARMVNNTPYSQVDFGAFYHWDNHEAFVRQMERVLEIERLARDNYPFFRPFGQIAGEAFSGDTSKWEHIDLFFNRETNQKRLENTILRNRAMGTLVSAQLDLSKRLIHYVEPKAIIVPNALASDIFKGTLSSEFPLVWNESHGYHLTTLRHKSVPVFLASTLTGQRAMDKGSYERLRWHIKKAINETRSLAE